MVLPGFLKSGSAGLSEVGGNKFVKVETGQSVEIIPLTSVEPPYGEEANGSNSVLSFNQYTKWMDDLPDGALSPMFPAIGGPSDPGKMLGLESRFRALLLCLVKGEEEEKVFVMGVSVFKQLIDIEQALDEKSIKGKVLKVSKTGSGLRTKWRIVPTGKSVEFEGEPETNLVDHVGPTTREEIIEMLTKAELWPPEGGDPYAKKTKLGAGKSKIEQKPSSKKPVKPPVEDDDEEEDWEEDDEEEETPPPPAKKKQPLGKPKPSETKSSPIKQQIGKGKQKPKPAIEEDEWDDEEFED